MTSCLHCREEVDVEFVFCPHCGKKSDDSSAPGVTTRPNDSAWKSNKPPITQRHRKLAWLNRPTLVLVNVGVAAVLTALLIKSFVGPNGGSDKRTSVTPSMTTKQISDSLSSGPAGQEGAMQTDTSNVTFKEYYEGLPNYAQHTPFVIPIPSEIEQSLLSIPKNNKDCAGASVKGWKALYTSNVCDGRMNRQLRDIIHKSAPELDPSKMTLITHDFNRDNIPELVLEYLILKEFDPYTAIWMISRDPDARYTSKYIGTYLVGRVYKMFPFGTEQAWDALFIRHESCTECCSTSYLDVANSANARHYQFSYDENKTWGNSMEFYLPGEGHTIDADVEIRIPSTMQQIAPHLMQYYRVKDGKDEWWVFNCHEYKCWSETYKRKLPGKYQEAWANAFVLKKLMDK